MPTLEELNTSEKGCSWHFSDQARGNEKGPNNPTDLTFKGTPFSSLVRESIQNSIDAKAKDADYVKVTFSYKELKGLDYKQFFKLREHVIGCLNKYPTNPNGQKQFGEMKALLPEFLLDQKIGCLCVRDENTTGMEYDPNDGESPFNAFISEGIAQKSNGAGGSFGFGKAVFWMFSPLNTVFVSTKTVSGHYFFEGQSKLCTHYIEAGHDLSPNGMYDAGHVICDLNEIPSGFVPSEIPGTSVFVLGVKYFLEDEQTELIKSVLRSFWMAIMKGKLVVDVFGQELKKDTLDGYMQSYFDETVTGKELHEYNPRPFYEIAKKAHAGEDGYKLVTASVPVNDQNWNISLFMRFDKDASNLFTFMRAPYMTIYTDKVSGCKGVEGVFVCDNNEGNEFLREMEDCSHDSWTPENYKARNHNDLSPARKAIRAIREFILNEVKKVIATEDQETSSVFGLESLISIAAPTNKLDSDGGDVFDPDTYVDEPIKKVSPPKPRKPSVKKAVRTSAVSDPNGRLRANSGKKKKHREYHGPIKPGNLKGKFTENELGVNGYFATPVDLSYRPWSQTDTDGVIWHYIALYSNVQIDNVLVQVFAVDNENKPKAINIYEAPGLILREGEAINKNIDDDDTSETCYNAISGIKINANIPKIIKFRFNSNIRYSLVINSDKIETNEE